MQDVMATEIKPGIVFMLINAHVGEYDTLICGPSSVTIIE